MSKTTISINNYECVVLPAPKGAFLIKEGFIKRTPRGREVTALAYQHLGRPADDRLGNASQGTLF